MRKEVLQPAVRLQEAMRFAGEALLLRLLLLLLTKAWCLGFLSLDE